MILVDVNLLIYASNPEAPEYKAAQTWLDERLSGFERVGLPWQSTLAFVRLMTNRRFFPRPVTVAVAWNHVESWLSRDNVWIPTPGKNHREILGKLLKDLGGGPNLVPDAHLAAIAIEHGLTLCSCDGDFARFPGLRWENPLRK